MPKGILRIKKIIELKPLHYILFSIIFLLSSFVGYISYDINFSKLLEGDVVNQEVKGVTAPNVLSFQGRMTDRSDTPITSPVSVTFNIYSVPTGGTALWTGTCSITPDQDGIFETLLGGTCGTSIPTTIFSENIDTYLGITVGSDSEMIPRQKIVSSAYALNADTLDGFDSSQTPGIGNVVVLDPSGNLTFGVTNPVISSSGDIILSPTDGVGINTTDPLAKLDVLNSTGDSFRAGNGTNYFFVNQNGTAISVIPANQSYFSAYSVQASADTYSRLGLGLDTGSPYIALGPGNTDKDIFLKRDLGDFTISFGTTPSEKFRFTSAGYLGIGTPTPSVALDVVGDIKASGTIRNVTVSGTVAETAATVAKTTTISNYTLTTGDLLSITFTSGNTAAAATLNVNETGAKNIRLGNTNVTAVNMTLAAGSTILMYYDGTYFQIMGSQRLTDTATNTYDRTYWNNAITAGAIIYDYKIVMQASNGKWYPLTLEEGTGTTKTVSTQPFNINSPILYYATTTNVAANGTFANVYSEIPTTNLHYTANTTTQTSQLPVYLKGTIDTNGNFVLDNSTYTSFLTQTLPTSEDGYVYILLGQMYSTTGLRLFQYHPMYEYKDGRVRPYGQGSTTFTGLIDTPSAYTSSGGYLVRVNAGATGLEFVEPGLFTDTNDYVDSVSFNSSDGVLTLGRTGALADLTADLDGRYALLSAGMPSGTEGQMLYNNAGTWTAYSGMYWNDTYNRLGINTTSPSVALDVAGQARFVSTTFPVVDIYRDTNGSAGSIYGGAKLERLMTGGTATNGTGIGFYFKAPDNTGVSTFAGMFGGALYDVTNGSEKGEIVFGASWAGADPYATRHLVIQATGASSSRVLIPNGTLGVNTTSTSYTLDVNGSARISTLSAGTTDSVVINSSGVLQSRTIDSRVWGSSSLVDGSGTANQLAYWSDSNTLGSIDYSSWDTNSSDDITSFLGLTDTPSAYTSSGGYLVRVNSGSTALEFVEASTYVDTDDQRWNEILDPNANKTFTMGAYTTDFQYNTFTSGSAFKLSSSSTGFTGSLGDITLSGSNAANTGSLLTLNNTGTLNTNTTFLINHYAEGTGNLAFRVNDESGDTTPFVIDGGGNVGIGISVPLSLLDVRKNSSGAIITLGPASGDLSPNVSLGRLRWWNTDISWDGPTEVASINAFTDNSVGSPFGQGGYLIFSTHSGSEGGEGSLPVERMRISSNGFIGVGTSTPDRALDVAGNIRLTSSDYPTLTLNDSRLDLGEERTVGGIISYQNDTSAPGVAGSIKWMTENTIIGTSSFNTKLIFSTTRNATLSERVIINSFGNVGIGVSSITGVLHIKAGTAAANTAPLKFTTGVNLTTAESGAMEWDGSRLYMTNTTLTRNTLAYTSDIYWTRNGTTLYPTTSGDSVLPNGTANLGSDTSRWADLFLSSSTLHLGSSTTDEGIISYDTTNNIFKFDTDSTTNGDISFLTDDLYLDKSSGNIGIGTTSPSSSLQINAPNGVTGLTINGGTYGDTDLFKMVGNANTQRLILERSGGATTFLEAGGSVGLFGTTTNHDFRIRTNYTDRMSITTAGYVGIGDISPTSLLTVGNGDLFQVNTSGDLIKIKNVTYSWPTSNGSGVLTNNGSGTLTWTAAAGATLWNEIVNPNANKTFTMGSYTTDFQYNTFTSGSAYKLSSSSTGFTGSLLDLSLTGSNAANIGNLLTLYNTGADNANTSLLINHYATGTNNLAFRVNDESGDTTPFVIDGQGRVGIGTDTPDHDLDVNGTIQAYNFITSSGMPVNDILLEEEVRNLSITAMTGSLGLDMTSDFVVKKAETTFSATMIGNTSATALTNGNIFIAYTKGLVWGPGCFVIYDSLGNQVVSETTFNAGNTYKFSATTLTNGNVFIAYQDYSDSSYGKFVIYDSLGNLVVSQTTFNAGSTGYPSATTLTNGNILIAYQDASDSNYSKFVIYDSLGNLVVSETTIKADNTYQTYVTTLTNGNILIGYLPNITPSNAFFVIYDSLGNLVVSETTFHAGNIMYASTTTLTNGNILIAYQDSSDSSYGKFVIYDSLGNLVVSETTFNAGNTLMVSATTLTNGNVFIAYRDASSSDFGKFVIYDSLGNLVVSETTFNAATSMISTTTLTNGNILISYKDTSDSSYGKFIIYGSSGAFFANKVGIGTSTPTQALDVLGSGRFSAVGSGTYASALNITSDGTLTTSTSDARLKTNIENIDSALEKVLQLRGVYFNWVEDENGQRMTGMIAQEVMEVMPELVFMNKVDGYYGINYGEATGLLIEAIKEQQKQIEALSLIYDSQNLDEFKLQMNASKVLKLTLNEEGNIELLGGEVLLAGDGTLSIRKLRVVQDYSIGSGKILAGQTKVVINTQAVTEQSKFFINPTSDSNNQVLYVTDIKVGESFTVNIKQALEQDITFDWFIVDSWLSNVKGIQESETPTEEEVVEETPIIEEEEAPIQEGQPEEETTTPTEEPLEETPIQEEQSEEETPAIPEEEEPTSQTETPPESPG